MQAWVPKDAEKSRIERRLLTTTVQYCLQYSFVIKNSRIPSATGLACYRLLTNSDAAPPSLAARKSAPTRLSYSSPLRPVASLEFAGRWYPSAAVQRPSLNHYSADPGAYREVYRHARCNDERFFHWVCLLCNALPASAPDLCVRACVAECSGCAQPFVHDIRA